MTQSPWKDLVTDNPMLIEIVRCRRRILSVGSGRAVNSGVLALAMLCYAGIVMMVVSMRGEIDPIALVIVQTFLLLMAAPALLHGAVAGERERRSWDLLLAAPVTDAQIVSGKIIGALTGLGVGVALFLFPTLIAVVTYKSFHPLEFMLSELVSITFAAAVCSLSLLISARVKRSFMALGATLTVLLVTLLIVPILIGTLAGGEQMTFEWTSYFNPFFAIAKLMEAGNSSVQGYSPLVYGLPQAAMYLAFSAIFIVWTVKTLHFADNEVKFVPRNRIDA